MGTSNVPLATRPPGRRTSPDRAGGPTDVEAPPVRRLASLFTALLVVLSVLAFVPTPAGAVQTPESVVVNPDPADWTPDILDGQVNAILQMGSKVVVGGTFTQVRRAGFSQIFDRNFLFAFDMDTGVIDPNFVPVLERRGGGARARPRRNLGLRRWRLQHRQRPELQEARPPEPLRRKHRHQLQGQHQRPRPGPRRCDRAGCTCRGSSRSIKSTSRSGLARLDPVTGNVDANLNLPFTNPPRGSLGVPEIDVSPDGSKLVAIGSFGQVGGLSRIQIAMLDLSTTPATVSAMADERVPGLRPEQPHHHVVRLGLLHLHARRRHRSGRLLLRRRHDRRLPREPALRHDLPLGAERHRARTSSPTWSNWTGGDTSWSVSASGTAVYVGGHMRWVNNPYRGDIAGPGAVSREGIVALSPLNGIPFSWNPTHERGVGIFTLPVTSDGLWVGSDTDHAGGEFHQKIAFFPAEGGAHPPADRHLCPTQRSLQPGSGGRGSHEPALVRPHQLRLHVDRASRDRLEERTGRVHVERQPLLRDGATAGSTSGPSTGPTSGPRRRSR